MDNTDVSVVIVNWNTEELLYKCIKSVKDKTSGLRYEIIVIDNNSADGSALMMKREFPDCKLIESKENLGFGKGNNRAAKEASGKYIFYLNPDTELITNALLGMFSFLESNKDFGAVGCKLILPNGPIEYPCASTYPTLLNNFCQLFLLNRIFPKSRFFSSRLLDYWNHKDSREIDCLSGACMMVRKDLNNRLNGFDENIFMYAEDTDLCYRIKKEGDKIFYLSTEVIMHHEGAGTKKGKSRNFPSLLKAESNYYFFRKHYGNTKATYFKLLFFWGSLFRTFILVIITPVCIGKLTRKDIDLLRSLDKYINLFLWSIGLRKVSNLI